ncbi:MULTISPECIES: hypothetical protein [Halanaerobium]|uniref:Uncharacterized protein n=1 Tax=Halanaerobium saccharolyticum TaxID=43595 RepID=A0A4R6RWB8_9FIRM|nr:MULTISPECIES: hypothetical protein [Halanaerobium]PUU90637.1 MAG: putative beta-lactamase [Halanaerobium sp.]TDP91329.1 hypothetical protein C7957_11768 [Halanaerobium saccharolyticum]
MIYELKDAPEIKINPGLVDKNEYNLVEFKGGSEPGVLQFTQLVQKSKDSDVYTISVTINNNEKAVEQQKVTQLTSRLIAAVIEDQRVN